MLTLHLNFSKSGLPLTSKLWILLLARPAASALALRLSLSAHIPKQMSLTCGYHRNRITDIAKFFSETGWHLVNISYSHSRLLWIFSNVSPHVHTSREAESCKCWLFQKFDMEEFKALDISRAFAWESSESKKVASISAEC